MSTYRPDSIILRLLDTDELTASVLGRDTSETIEDAWDYLFREPDGKRQLLDSLFQDPDVHKTLSECSAKLGDLLDVVRKHVSDEATYAFLDEFLRRVGLWSAASAFKHWRELENAFRSADIEEDMRDRQARENGAREPGDETELEPTIATEASATESQAVTAEDDPNLLAEILSAAGVATAAGVDGT